MLYGQNVLGKKLSLYFLPAKSEGNYVNLKWNFRDKNLVFFSKCLTQLQYCYSELDNPWQLLIISV